MSVSPVEFWQRLQQSGLMSSSRIKRLRDNINARNDISAGETAEGLANLLVSNKLLTRYQAETLLQGLPVTFRLGPYTILEPDDEWTEAGWLRARDNTDGTELRLRYLSDDETDEAELMLRGASDVRIETHQGKRVILAWTENSPASEAHGLPSVRISSAAASVPRPTPWHRIGLSGIVATGLVAALGVMLGLWGRMPRDRPVADTPPQVAPKVTDDSITSADTSAELWARALSGEPIPVTYLPDEVQAICHLRLAALKQHGEGDRILRSLGPKFDDLLTTWLARIGVSARQVDYVTVALLPQGSTLPKVVTMVRLSDELDRTSLASYRNADEDHIARIATDGIWFPPDSQHALVYGPYEEVQQLGLRSEPSVQFRSEFGQLLRQSDRLDHLTILANANFLSDEAAGLFPDSRRELLKALIDFWSDEAQSFLLQLQLTDVAVGELRVIPRLEMAPRILAARMKQRLEDLPARISDYVGGLQLDPYWQRLALRFPTMVGFLADQTRIIVDERQVALSTVVPVEAIHNLLLASELSLASMSMEVPAQPLEDRSHWTLQDLLGGQTSIDMAQESLDAAVREIERQIQEDFPGLPWSFRIEILGADLEQEGITRNQQIRDFHQSGRTVAEVLTALVMAANPVKTVTAPTAADQRLIWATSQDSPGKIFITTRSAAKNRGLSVPGAFLSE